ncbi:hypothetical protein MTO96_028866 [Rhipicephalus appendiculatus]
MDKGAGEQKSSTGSDDEYISDEEGAAPESRLSDEQTTPVSPRSSDNQTSSDQLSVQKSSALTRSAESLANASISSGLSSSSNVDKFSEPVHAAGEGVPAIVENLESPSLTDVSDSPLQSDLKNFLAESGASSSVASSSHRSESSRGDGKSSGADDSSSEEHGPLVLREHSPDVARTPLEGTKECVSLGHKDISRTASGEPELSEGALLQVSMTALSDRPDSSETSTTDTIEEATVVHRKALHADDGDASPTGSLLDHVTPGVHVAQFLEGKGGCAVDNMELAHPVTSLNEESVDVFHFATIKPQSPTETDDVRADEQEASTRSKADSEKVADRTKLALDLNKEELPVQKGATPDILSPQSDVTDEDTTCSASISDQEVFPSDADKLATLEDPVVPSPIPHPIPRELLHAPIASMSDEDDLTASDLSRRGLQHNKSEPSVSKKTLLETMKEVQEALGPALAAATPVGQQSDGDDFTVSEWAREGGDKESLSFVEDLKAEFSFDDRNVTRRRRRKEFLLATGKMQKL